MPMTPFHAIFTARELSAYSHADRLIAAYASSDIEVYPYQISAATFALRSPFLKGVVLADEGSLGKTYEALLIITQLWFEGKERILITVPTPLLYQWVEILERNFNVPFVLAETEGFDFQGIVLTTYEFATHEAEHIGQIVWNIVVFDEAHRISKSDNKTTIALKAAIGDAFKLLLTATPMQNSIMDLYGLIAFIDESVLPAADIFYRRYFRKPENYFELTATASRYCFRTLRSQVEQYVMIPRRIPVTADYKLTASEIKLSEMLDDYLKKPEKEAFPKMDNYDLALMLSRSLSSSTSAFDSLLQGAIERVAEPELVEMQKLATTITANTKGQELVKVLKRAFVELEKLSANRKALIFTENRATLKYLFNLLKDCGYNVLAYSGEKSRDYDIIKRFEKDADILVTTDVAAEGFHFAFCSFIVNYDLPYNALTLEQRIMRCHRHGQKNDVVVLNFLSKSNLADVRMLELVNKRVLQFDGIMGMSDDVVGNFCENAADGISAAFTQSRHKKDIETEFKTSLATNEAANTTAVKEAENALFTTFTRDVAEKLTITPQYIKDRSEEMNCKLWELTKWFFADKQGYYINEDTKTLHVGIQPQKVFTGTALRAREYSLVGKTLSLASSIAKNIIGEIFWRGIPDSGRVIVESLDHFCEVGYYRVKCKSPSYSQNSKTYYAFVGTTNSELLSDNDCRKIMSLPVIRYTTDGSTYGDRDGISKPKSSHPIDKLLDPTTFLRLAVSDTDTDDARREEISAINDRSYHRKQYLNREIEVLKTELKQTEHTLSRMGNVSERVDAEKKRAATNKELKQREQTLFLEGLRIDTEAEQAIMQLTESANLKLEITRMFAITVYGGNTNG